MRIVARADPAATRVAVETRSAVPSCCRSRIHTARRFVEKHESDLVEAVGELSPVRDRHRRRQLQRVTVDPGRQCAGKRPCGTRALRATSSARRYASAEQLRPHRRRRRARRGRPRGSPQRAGSRPRAVAFASPVSQPPSRRHSAKISSPPARRMAPSHPAPGASASFAAFTIASTCWSSGRRRRT